MTMSGKSTLAKLMIKKQRGRGMKTAVLDPLGDPSFNADFQTANSDEFLKFCKENKDYYLYVDEGGTSIGRYNGPMEWLATSARHNGHLCTFISHGITQLPVILRSQCDRLFLFTCAAQNCDTAADEWNEKELLHVERIEKYHFFLVRRFGKLKRGSISLDNEDIVWDT